MFLIYAGIFLTVVIALLIYPLWMKRNRSLITGEAASQDEERINQQIEKQTLLSSLADLEIDHSQGKCAPEDYHRLKLSFEHRLLNLLQQLETGRRQEGANPASAVPLPSGGRGWSVAISLVLALLVASGTAGLHHLVYGKIARSQEASGGGGGGGEGTPPVNPVEMVERLEKRLKENPNDLQGQMMAGRSYAALQRWDDARKAWKKAVELDGRNEAAQFNYADALMRTAGPDDQAAYKEALEHLEIALMKAPREPVVLWTKGVALLRLGRTMEADQAWTAAYQSLPPGSKDAEFVKKALQDLRSGKTAAN